MEPQPVSIIIPVFNEVGGLAETVRRTRAILKSLPAGSEMIVVDDGSGDGGTAALRKLADEDRGAERYLFHPRNRGYGAALMTGIVAARSPMIAIADADGTYPIERIPELLDTLAGEDATMVVGARPVRQQPAIRRPAKRVLQLLAEYLTGERIPDLNSGLRLFRRDDAIRLRTLLPQGFSFTTTITLALLTEGGRVVYVPIRYRRRVGHSKIRPIRDTANFLLLIFRTTLAFNPMKVFGPIGFSLVLVGVTLLVLRVFVDNFGVATTITFLIGGLQILAIGLLADLVNRRGHH